MNHMYLVDDVLAKDVAQESLREGFGRGLVAAAQNEQIVAAFTPNF